MTFNFAMQAIDQIINSAAKTRYMSGGQMHTSIVFRGPNGAAARVAAQHSQDYSSWYSHIPGLKVIAPFTAADAKGLLKSAIRDPNPVIFLENEILYGQSSPVPKLDDYVVPIGKAKVVRAGNDVTIVSWSIGMTYALKAADELAKDGIDAEVIDLRTLKPMDSDTIIASVQEDQPAGHRRGGLAAVGRRRRDRRARHGRGVRLSRCAGHPRQRQGRADAVRRQSRKAGAAVGRRRGRGGQSRLLPVSAMASPYRRAMPYRRPPWSTAASRCCAPRSWMAACTCRCARAFDDPQAWGMLIADVARHAARIFANETKLTEDQALELIRVMFEAEMDAPTDPGTTSAIS